MSESPLRPDRRRLRRVAAPLTSSSTTSQASRASSSTHCPPRRRRSTSAAAPACWPPASRTRGYEMAGVDPSEGMLRVLEQSTPTVRRRSRGSGTALPFPDASFDLVYCVARHAPHRRAGRRAADARRDGARGEARRPDPRLGPQPAQPVLAAPDGARAAGHRGGAADRRGRDASRPADAGAEPVLVDAGREWSPTSPRARLLGAAAAAERAVERTPLVRGICAHNVVLASKAPAVSA